MQSVYKSLSSPKIDRTLDGSTVLLAILGQLAIILLAGIELRVCVSIPETFALCFLDVAFILASVATLFDIDRLTKLNDVRQQSSRCAIALTSSYIIVPILIASMIVVVF